MFLKTQLPGDQIKAKQRAYLIEQLPKNQKNCVETTRILLTTHVSDASWLQTGSENELTVNLTDCKPHIAGKGFSKQISETERPKHKRSTLKNYTDYNYQYDNIK